VPLVTARRAAVPVASRRPAWDVGICIAV